MSLIRSLVAFASALTAVLAAYAFGHALSNHHSAPMILSAIALAVTAVLVFAQVRIGRGNRAPH